MALRASRLMFSSARVLSRNIYARSMKLPIAFIVQHRKFEQKPGNTNSRCHGTAVHWEVRTVIDQRSAIDRGTDSVHSLELSFYAFSHSAVYNQAMLNTEMVKSLQTSYA
jgi:hypothetical protein